MKKLSLVVGLLLALVVLSACGPEMQAEVPPLTDPTDFQGVLVWLASGGAGAFIAVWIEKQKWFQAIASHYKPVVVLGCIIVVALIPRVLLDFVPAGVWAAVQPYFATIVTAVLVGYPLSQLFHEVINRQAANRKAFAAEQERQWKILE